MHMYVCIHAGRLYNNKRCVYVVFLRYEQYVLTCIKNQVLLPFQIVSDKKYIINGLLDAAFLFPPYAKCVTYLCSDALNRYIYLFIFFLKREYEQKFICLFPSKLYIYIYIKMKEDLIKAEIYLDTYLDPSGSTE
jgi:hypothetical protein